MQAAALVYLAACLGLRLLLPFPSQGAERTGGTREESFLELLEKGASSLPEDSPFVPVDLSFQWSFRYDDFRPNPEYTKSPLAARIQRLLGEGRLTPCA